jgi:hypothetical protein
MKYQRVRSTNVECETDRPQFVFVEETSGVSLFDLEIDFCPTEAKKPNQRKQSGHIIHRIC